MASKSNKNTKIYTELLISHNNIKNKNNKTNDKKDIQTKILCKCSSRIQSYLT